ncbi:uncharacterized protein LOC123514963 isoform X1 [Portunus trituberculatus]|uniref:uncharacterized protein LOC123514963 isoform X1 n=1 Tax=Portunus trituberculatus TaxID=210409 RepID=UPI001E1CE42A|nr:uncharacterized protein LOC123514963 isoform X1 [Portunus trituberculatus]XP_045129180.1 uncharacterized protein LOC123514963 isoform X1 [Portunus trituberculatus]XP_045129181.1 uncharacterized protein LOC123514963 isoform X1 [Portunus trituberculatus]
MEKLDKSAGASTNQESFSGFSGAHALSSSDEDREIPDLFMDGGSDPLDDLDNMATTNPVVDEEDNSEFLRALEELSSHFHGEEEKGEPLSERLATILNASLRRRPSTEGVKMTYNKIKLPSNVPNLTVPSTNSALTKAMSSGGKLIDTRLFHTNSLISKAIVSIAQCVSDIGERSGKTIGHYLDGLNNSIRLLASAVNYMNQLRKEVARLHVNDSALAELCRWECEVGRDTLFPFDVTKKCDEIHKTKRLGRYPNRPYRTTGPRRFTQIRRPYNRRPYYQQRGDSRNSRPFLGKMASQGRGMHPHHASH